MEVNLEETKPIEYSRRGRRILTYRKVRTEHLSKEGLRESYKALAFRETPDIIESTRGLLIQYRNKPPMFISKETGKVYSPKDSWPRKEVEHQASLLLRVLNSLGLVEEYKRVSIPKKRGRREEREKH